MTRWTARLPSARSCLSRLRHAAVFTYHPPTNQHIHTPCHHTTHPSPPLPLAATRLQRASYSDCATSSRNSSQKQPHSLGKSTVHTVSQWSLLHSCDAMGLLTRPGRRRRPQSQPLAAHCHRGQVADSHRRQISHSCSVQPGVAWRTGKSYKRRVPAQSTPI